MTVETGQRRPVVYLSYIACYPLWLVTAALGLVDVAALRAGVERAYVAFGLDKWGMAAASHSATMVLGLAWLIGIMWAEHAYRTGARNGRLWKRFAVATMFQALPLALLLWR